MIKTGEGSIAWNSFSECSDLKKVVWIENGIQTVIGSTSEEVVVDKGKDLLYRKQRLIFLNPNKPNRTVNVTLHLPTFEPLACTDHGQRNVYLDYHSNEVEVAFEEEGIENTNKHVLEDGVFDLFSIELILRLLPLENGYKNEIKAFNHMVNDTVIVRIEVLGLEKIFDGAREVDAWCVSVYIGESLQTYWVSKDLKELLKQSVKIGDGVFFEFVR
ncbi:DUF3108 domain-containing protein [Pseudoneobacillus rhizosphaerae]|uniref:Uncharacterized protein n=1 Tax=Pseudoneobacillus rhizosphaerae TaxID=2880968 RepID=A0A9C7LAQ8_9BACI|nr:hypothetical protein [Pseudoneobacillus rhizosphaerae]CAG9608732.1 hypothetical protein NEOCIP111885_02449 [Pseudoneobacillus rhizosphaerae]